MDKLTIHEQRFIDELYNQYYDRLLQYASRFLDAAAAEDAVQNVFADACMKVEELMEHDDAGGWLFVGLRFAVGKIVRSRQPAVQTISVPPHADPEAGVRLGIEDLPDERPQPESVDVLYGDLADCREFQLLKKYAVEDKSVRDIAREFGISVGACKTRMFRAREKLRLLMKK